MLLELSSTVVVTVPGIVEKFNPLKPSALSRKRELQRGARRGKLVNIREITLEEVKNDAISFGLATEVLGQINAGKEAAIFIAKWKKHPILLKAYRLWRSSHASKSKGAFAYGRMQMYAAREYDRLWTCYTSEVRVPTPIGRVGNYLTMRFIGDGTNPAPQLKDVELSDPERVLDQILEDYLLMYTKARFVHGDLSKYNILWWRNHAWIIDLPQAIELNAWTDMNSAESTLRRDIRNVLSHFKKEYSVSRNQENIVQVFLSEFIPSNLDNYDESVGSWIE